MAPRERGVPAWRRLGLVLDSEDQSRADVPISPPCRHDAQRAAAHENPGDARQNLQKPFKPVVNSKQSRRGKSQPEGIQAEQALKQSTTASQRRETAVAQSNAAEAAAALDPVPHREQPKGDLNYRKKKAKPKKPRREGHNGTPTEASPAHIAPPLDETAAADDRPTLLASTETDFIDSVPHTPNNDQRNEETALQVRRKRVSFTPDTKTTDGNSGQTLFKQRFAKTKIQEPESEEVVPKPQSALTSNETKPLTSTPSTPSSRKKKVPSVYLEYLMQYFTDRPTWKFNKAKQNYVVDNALNIFRIPEDHSEALLEYVSGLKGAGVIARLKESCEAFLNDMNDIEAREQVQEEALQDRVSRERKRRKLEGDIEDFHRHPDGDRYLRRLQRERGEGLLTAISRAAPILPADPHANGINPLVRSLAPLTRDSKKRKRRGEVSSDESSSDSSSEEISSSSESESETTSESESDDDESDSSSNDESDDDGDSSTDTDSDDENPTKSIDGESDSSDSEDESSSKTSKSSDGSSDSDPD